MAAALRSLVSSPTETRETISEQNNEYQRIESWIRQSLPNVRITGMEKVTNSFLRSSYELKKAEYGAKQKAVREVQLLHATAAGKVDSICKENFDWRLIFRAKFGKGTSFSPNADYANCHCNRKNGFRRAFIVTSVIMADEDEGCENLNIPFGNNDTTTNHNGLVYVKYQDNEFLPLFVVYYECPDSMISGSQYYRNWWR